MSAVETIKSAYAALGRNDPSALFAAMDPTINWNEAEGNPLADRDRYVVRPWGKVCLAGCWRLSTTSPLCPVRLLTAAATSLSRSLWRRDERRRRAARLAVLPRVPIEGDKAVMFSNSPTPLSGRG